MKTFLLTALLLMLLGLSVFGQAIQKNLFTTNQTAAIVAGTGVTMSTNTGTGVITVSSTGGATNGIQQLNGTGTNTTLVSPKADTLTINSGSTGLTNAQTRQDIQTNLTDTLWTKNIALVFCGDSLTSTDHVNWPVYLTNAVGGPWSNAPVTFATNTAVGSDLAGNIWTNYATRIGQYILATTSATTNVYLFIWAGINDIGVTGGHLGATNAIASLSNIWAQARFQGAKVIAFTISDAALFTTQDEYERQNLNRLIRNSGHNGTNGWDYLVDVDNYIAGGTIVPSYLNNTLDGVHFNTNSQALIAKQVDWSVRNGTRANAPFAPSQVDSVHAAGAPSIWWPNTLHRKLTITPDYLQDNNGGIFGMGLSLQDTTNYVGFEMASPAVMFAFWSGGVSGHFQGYAAATPIANYDATPYFDFTYSTKVWLFKNSFATPALTVNTILATNGATFNTATVNTGNSGATNVPNWTDVTNIVLALTVPAANKVDVTNGYTVGITNTLFVRQSNTTLSIASSTNAIIDFGLSDRETATLSGNLNIYQSTNRTAGFSSKHQVKMYPNGSDRIITLTNANWYFTNNIGATSRTITLTNGWVGMLSVDCDGSSETNVVAIFTVFHQ